MTNELLNDLVRVNLVAAAAILVVLALRLAVGRGFGARAAYRLWAVVPLAAGAALLPARHVEMVVTAAAGPVPAPPQTQIDVAALATHALLPSFDLAALGLAVWAIGALAWLAALARSQYAFGRSLGRIEARDGVYRAESEAIGPVLLGVLRPRIVLPADFEARFEPEERAIVLAHERAHLKSGDHLVNAVVALAQCLCWFNPLVHLAARHLRIDQELACDAAVVARHPEQRRSYAQAMLKAQLSDASALLACHWPGRGAHPLKRRIALLQAATPSPARRAAGLAVVAAVSLGAGAVAWAAQPADVDVVTRHAPLTRPTATSAELWRAEVAAEAKAAAMTGRRNIPAPEARRLDRELMEAVLEGDAERAMSLLKAGADVNAEVTGDGSPLIVAAREGRLDIAARLVAGGANVNGFVLYDETPLINASRAGHLSMVRFLLDRGADPNLAVPSGNKPGELRSPLGMAGDPLVANYLKSRGARS